MSALEIAKSGANLVSDKKVDFLEIWDVPWQISMATARRVTFTCLHASQVLPGDPSPCHAIHLRPPTTCSIH